MATEKIVYVNPNSSGGDGSTDATSGASAAYASLDAAILAQQSANSDLVSAGIWLNIKCGGSAADTARINNGGGFTTDSDHYIQVICEGDQAASPLWSTSKYRYSVSHNGTAMTLNAVDNIRFVNVQIENTNAGSSVSGMSFVSNNTSNDYRFIGCYIRNPNSTGNGTGVAHFQGGAVGTKLDYFINNIFEGWNVGYNVADRATSALYTNTLVSCNTGSHIDGVAGNHNLTNNLYYNCGIDIFGFDAARDTATYNATSNSTLGDDVTGTGNRVSQTFSFLTAGDYHLASGDTGAKGFGTDLSADAIYPFNYDIENAIRNGTWDIGCSQTIATLLKRPRSRYIYLG